MYIVFFMEHVSHLKNHQSSIPILMADRDFTATHFAVHVYLAVPYSFCCGILGQLNGLFFVTKIK